MSAPAPRPRARLSRALVVVAAIAGIVPLFVGRHLPMADLPEHVAAMATIRHYWDASFRAHEYFQLARVYETSYFLYQAVGAALSVVTGSAERANLVMMALVGLGYTFSLRALLAALRRDTRLAVLGPALFWTQNLTVGLLNFVASVPVVLFALASAVAYTKRPTRRRAVGLALLSVAILYLHVSSFLLFVAEAFALALLAEDTLPASREALFRRVACVPRRVVWLAPALTLGTIVALAGRTGAGDGHASGLHYEPRLALLAQIPHWLFDNFRTRIDDVLGLVVVSTLLVLTGVGVGRLARPSLPRARVVRPLVMAALAWVFVLAMPTRAGAYAFLLDVRMSVYVGAFALLLPTPSFRKVTRPLHAVVAVATLGLMTNVVYEVRAFERDDVGAFDDLLRKMPRGARLLSLDYAKYSSRTNASVLHHFGSYYRARYGGIASFSFSEMPHWPVRYRPEWSPPQRMTFGNPNVFDPERDGAYFDFVLVHGDARPLDGAAVAPRWEVIGVARGFRLYRKLGPDEAKAQAALRSL